MGVIVVLACDYRTNSNKTVDSYIALLCYPSPIFSYKKALDNKKSHIHNK